MFLEIFYLYNNWNNIVCNLNYVKLNQLLLLFPIYSQEIYKIDVINFFTYEHHYLYSNVLNMVSKLLDLLDIFKRLMRAQSLKIVFYIS